MTQAEKIRYLQLINHILLIVGIYFSVYPIWYSIILALVFGVLGINIGFHRYLTHNSFQTNKFTNMFLLYMGTLCLIGTPLTWAISHINHHVYADAEGDPYSPHRINIWNFLMTRFEPVKHPMLGAKTIVKNKAAMWLHQNYFKAILIYCLLLCLIDPWLIIYAWSIPSLVALYLLLLTNIVCHLNGYRNYETKDKSHNNIFISIITLGEGWHNNHHKDPSQYNLRNKWFEIDPTAWIIGLIKK